MELRDVTAFISETTGLDPASIGLPSVEQTVRARIKKTGCNDEQGYLNLLRKSQDERGELIQSISVPETWFFRDREVFAYLKGLLAAGWNGRRPIRVLCVPCCTGEEAYSIAMTFSGAGIGPRDARVVAVDICPGFIKKAQNGVFGRNSFRGGEPGMLDRYFETLPDSFRIRREVADYIEWRTGNLVDVFFLSGEGFFDAVFCRNLFIYLRADMRAQAMRSIKRLLAPDGILFMGACETPHGQGFKPVEHTGAFAFRRHDTRETECPPPSRFTRPPEPVSLPAVSAAGAAPNPVAARQDAPALREDHESLNRKAQELADRGLLGEAREMLEKSLRLDPSSAEAHLLAGLVEEELKDDLKAENHFRKALYLESSCSEALVHLLCFAKKRGDQDLAESYRRRLENLKKRSADR